ncbi:putative transcription factor C2C2-CO-like family [Medicago truncatula]|uniref:Putative transcription factor C2C2-CO-like family n=1 Tax=Medicago truncatula TaxID=3880 RepID=G7I7K7_MEDTR|nr:zinc finger protein CONSTANS-LIKE 4 [Medicago truncatula]AES59059.1 zinc finger constans-like protein [Medicago truncatula]RHN77044.1 putative transcription factor C2C2-CO-like family [Medicago truncatula]
MATKLCDSCKSTKATLFCRSDSAFLCLTCDSNIHAANKLASRHHRVTLCQVCEQAPAHVTCKADAAVLCISCDHDIHSANPLARRHERVPLTTTFNHQNSQQQSFFSENDHDATTEEAEAASWLLQTPSNPKFPDLNYSHYSYPEIDDFVTVNTKTDLPEQNSPGTTADGVVPVQSHSKTATEHEHEHYSDINIDFSNSKPFTYNFNHTVSSPSMDVGVVPDGNVMTEISYCSYQTTATETAPMTVAVPMTAVEREARVMRYREKRKNRRFEKTIRYASRKAYAETRPRIKGRFAKRSDLNMNLIAEDEYGVVPSC